MKRAEMETQHIEKTFLNPFVQSRREMAYQVPTKGFLLLSPEAATCTLSGPSVDICPSPPVPPFLLPHNLSPKDIARSDITS